MKEGWEDWFTPEEIEFAERFGTTMEEADTARNVALIGEYLIQSFIDEGKIDEKMMKEVENDEGMQTLYLEYLRMYEETGYHPALDLEFMPDHPERVCGWYRFFREYHEEKWGLRLISPEEMAQPPEQQQRGPFGRKTRGR